MFNKVFNALIMGSLPGHPTEPLLVLAGNLDGTGDGVTIAGDMQGRFQPVVATPVWSSCLGQ